MVKVSIIVPVYNSEQYLKECLDSLVNQTLDDIEIICINDGSTDKSLEILKSYEAKGITFLSQENKGVSAARNLGIENAHGEFITFVDSDDWIKPETCEILYKTAKERNTDVLLFSHLNYTEYSLTRETRLESFEHKLNGKTTTLKESAKDIFNSPTGICGKFYKTSLIKNNNIKFPPDINCCEDTVFFVKSCLKAGSISVINIPLYYYRRNSLNSLSKEGANSFSNAFKSIQIIKGILKNTDNFIYESFLTDSIDCLLDFWNSCYYSQSRNKGIRYLKLLKQDCNKYKRKYKRIPDGYQQLCNCINSYHFLFLKKLLEPLFELELRRNRIVIYLFQYQVINFNTIKLSQRINSLRYFFKLLQLRFAAKKRKIRVGFYLSEIQKWSSQAAIYKAMENSPYFEPFVMAASLKIKREDLEYSEITNFLKEKKLNFVEVYNEKTLEHIPLDKFKPDIIFYQQPWQIDENQNIDNTSKSALICYTPYCFYSLNSCVNYMLGFHGKLWKYFVETSKHKKDYEEKYSAKNCIAMGSCKLDNYKTIDNTQWKSNGRKRIIYSPHNTFKSCDFDYATATFDKNGQFILELAKSHPEFEWVFRPHPVFKERVLKYNICSKQEIEQYYSEWEKIGQIYTGADYYNLFANSDCLITDCISFLTEYLPTEKPILHLLKDEPRGEFNSLLKIITDDYYKIYDNQTLAKTFEEVIVNDNDYLKEKRLKNISLLMIDENKTTGEKIKEYLEKELWISKNI